MPARGVWGHALLEATAIKLCISNTLERHQKDFEKTSETHRKHFVGNASETHRKDLGNTSETYRKSIGPAVGPAPECTTGPPYVPRPPALFGCTKVKLRATE